jgi:Helix-turn-helix domain
MSNVQNTTSSRDHSAHTQCTRLLNYLIRNHVVSTTECRNNLDIISPAPRIFELREQGFRIATHWTRDERNHRVANYVLIVGGRNE